MTLHILSIWKLTLTASTSGCTAVDFLLHVTNLQLSTRRFRPVPFLVAAIELFKLVLRVRLPVACVAPLLRKQRIFKRLVQPFSSRHPSSDEIVELFCSGCARDFRVITRCRVEEAERDVIDQHSPCPEELLILSSRAFRQVEIISDDAPHLSAEASPPRELHRVHAELVRETVLANRSAYERVLPRAPLILKEALHNERRLARGSSVFIHDDPNSLRDTANAVRIRELPLHKFRLATEWEGPGSRERRRHRAVQKDLGRPVEIWKMLTCKQGYGRNTTINKSTYHIIMDQNV